MERKLKKETKETGITLITLAITIIVLIILSAVTYNLILGENGIITKAYEAKYLTELSEYKEELELFKAEKLLENNNFEGESLTSAYNSLIYNTQKEGETGNIYDVIKSLEGGTFDGKMEIIKGELLLNSQDMIEIRMAQKLDIQVNPYLIVDGVLLSANTNLALMDENGSLTIPESVRAIGEGAFADLYGLKTIIIPGTVKEIRTNAFRNNADLENVILMEGVETIGDNAFQDCKKIVNVELPESLLNIGRQTFYQCSNLKEIKIPSKITTLNYGTFWSCYNLEKIELPENLNTINSTVFWNCYKLDNLFIPKSVEYIQGDIFYNCTNLSNIEVESENKNYKYDKNSGILMTLDGNNIIFISSKILANNSTFEIPEGIINFDLRIKSYTNITKIIIPESLKTIGGAYEFPNNIAEVEVNKNNQYFSVEKDCLYNKDKTELIMCFTKNSTVELSSNLEVIKKYSFDQATNITNIELPESVLKIETRAFEYNKKIEKINIGPNVNYIDPLFKFANYVGTVTIDENNKYYTVEDNVLYNKDKTKIIKVLYEIDGKYTVKNSVTNLGSYSFYNQNKMTEIELPEGLKTIENYPFSICNNLTSIYIPSSVETILSLAFADANNLQQIQIDKVAGSIEGSPWGAIRGDRIVEWLR